MSQATLPDTTLKTGARTPVEETYLLDDLLGVHIAVLVELLLGDGWQDGLEGLL